jgi:ketosteroid isomerase-like protein
MDQEKQHGRTRGKDAHAVGPGSKLPNEDEFFSPVKSDAHHSKPEQEAIAAALQAVQQLGLQADADDSVSDVAEAQEGRRCLSCGKPNRAGNRFCSGCGVPLQDAAAQDADFPASAPNARPATAGQHYYHHHYHHHYFSSSEGIAPPSGADHAAGSAPMGRAPRAPTAGGTLSRAETAVRKLSQDWALACNTKQLDDLVELYGPDAIVLRPNVPPMRGTAAIREFFFTQLDAGMGEVEMESLRTEVFGDIAYEAGRCQMLVPVAVGQRREERGKYLITAARQAGDWKILADCWSSDLSLGVSVEPGPAKSTAPVAGPPVLRPPRKSA